MEKVAPHRRARGTLSCPRPALVPGTENKPRCSPPPPFPFGMLILVQEFPTLPRVPRPSRPCKVTSVAGHLVVITHQGRGLWWAQPVQSPRALGGWSLSSEGAQLLLALISCGDFLTALETPRRLGLWELRWLGIDGRFPHPQLEPHPLKPSGDPVYRMLGALGVKAGKDGEGCRGWDTPAAQRPADCLYNIERPPPLSDPQFPHLLLQKQHLFHRVISKSRPSRAFFLDMARGSASIRDARAISTPV